MQTVNLIYSPLKTSLFVKIFLYIYLNKIQIDTKNKIKILRFKLELIHRGSMSYFLLCTWNLEASYTENSGFKGL